MPETIEEIYLCPICWNEEENKKVCWLCEGTGTIF
jgi:hypothetical protein